jgi:hypothetical protein
MLLDLDNDRWAVSDEPWKQERVTCNCTWAAIPATKVSTATRYSRPSLCDRSRDWNGNQATVPEA